MTREDPSQPRDVSYSVRDERNRAVWLSRILGTGTLFTTGMGLAVLLGRRRP